MFRPTEWDVVCGEHIYKVIGYERRGIYNIPVAECINGKYISCVVYEIIKGYKTIGKKDHIGAVQLNDVEIALLKEVGCKYTGCWIERE